VGIGVATVGSTLAATGVAPGVATIVGNVVATGAPEHAANSSPHTVIRHATDSRLEARLPPRAMGPSI